VATTRRLFEGAVFARLDTPAHDAITLDASAMPAPWSEFVRQGDGPAFIDGHRTNG
jgi:hypothetical protein